MTFGNYVRLMNKALELRPDWREMPVVFDSVDKASNYLSTNLEYCSIMIHGNKVVIHVEDRI